ncbi:MAG: AEC family transporter [Tepidisphaeraceae bacterium]
MSEFVIVAKEVLAVYLIVAAGAVLRVVGWLKPEADASVMKFVAFLLIPCLFFSKVVGDPKYTHFVDVVAPVSVGFGTTVLGFVLAGVVAYGLRRAVALPTPEHRSAFTLCTGMYNYGYLPLPLADALYPAATLLATVATTQGNRDSTVPTMMVHNVGVEFALWTVGIVIISGGLAKGWWVHLFNPPAVAIACAVAINMLGADAYVPYVVTKATTDLGRCAIPVGLLVTGAVMLDLLRSMKWHHGLNTLFTASVLRMGILPVLFLLLARYMPVSVELKRVIMLQAAMPAAMFPVVVTRLYKQDTETAVRVVAGTAIIGMATIPLWIWAGRWYLDV